MTAGTGIAFALNVKIGGVEEGTIGIILIVAGIAVLLLSLISAPFRHFGRSRHEHVVEDRRPASPTHRY
jgi:hypothetical protein